MNKIACGATNAPPRSSWPADPLRPSRSAPSAATPWISPPVRCAPLTARPGSRHGAPSWISSRLWLAASRPMCRARASRDWFRDGVVIFCIGPGGIKASPDEGRFLPSPFQFCRLRIRGVLHVRVNTELAARTVTLKSKCMQQFTFRHSCARISRPVVSLVPVPATRLSAAQTISVGQSVGLQSTFHPTLRRTWGFAGAMCRK